MKQAENNIGLQLDHKKASDFEDKIRKIFTTLILWCIPLAFAIFGFYVKSLNNKYEPTGNFLLRYIAPLLLLPVLVVLFILCLFQIKNGISGKPILSGKVSRQPFIFLGAILFLFLSALCALIIFGIFYLFFI